MFDPLNCSFWVCSSNWKPTHLIHTLQNLAHCPEDESVILSSLYNTIAGLSIKQGKIFDRINRNLIIFTLSLTVFQCCCSWGQWGVWFPRCPLRLVQTAGKNHKIFFTLFTLCKLFIYEGVDWEQVNEIYAPYCTDNLCNVLNCLQFLFFGGSLKNLMEFL